MPVITLVVYFGSDEWDGPMCLHEMLAIQNENLLALVPDYRINLLSPESMSDEDINRFQTSLREVMLYIKYSNDKEKLITLLQADERFKTVERKAAEVMSTVTGSELIIKEEADSVDMCEAIKNIREEERLLGQEQSTLKAI